MRFSLFCALAVSVMGLRAQTIAFNPPNSVTTGSSASGIATGDFNKDGKRDLVTGHIGTLDVHVELGLGGGAFAAPVSYPVGGIPYFVTVADVNADGNDDILVSVTRNNSIVILFGRGDGTFQSPATVTVGVFGPAAINNTSFFAVGDLNGDNKPDLVVTGQRTAGIFVLLNQGTGTFGSPAFYPTPSFPASVAIGDVTGDGKADVLTANTDTGNLSLFPGTGTGLLGTPTLINAAPAPRFVSLVDMNQDGKKDLVVAGMGTPGQMSVSLANAAGGFIPPALYPGATFPISINIADVTGDGLPDVTVLDGLSNKVCWQGGKADGTLLDPVCVLSGNTPSALVVDDLDGDGKKDVAVANSTDAKVIPAIGQSACPATGTNCTTPGHNQALKTVGAPVWYFHGSSYRGALMDNNNQLTIYNENFSGGFHYEKLKSIPILSPPPSSDPYAVGGTTGYQDNKLFLVFIIQNPPAIVVFDETADPPQPPLVIPVNFTPTAITREGNKMSITDSNGFVREYTDLVSITSNDLSPNITPRAPVTGTNPVALASGDFNGDGFSDLVSANKDSNNVSVILRNVDGSLRNAVNYPAGTQPVAVSVGDINKDGKLDIVVANSGSANFSVLLGRGDGTFQAATQISVGNATPGGLVLADFNLDGKLDVAVSLTNRNSISVFAGNGDGTFQSAVSVSSDISPTTLLVADLNGDGRPDLIASNPGGPSTALILNSTNVPLSSVNLTSTPAGLQGNIGGIGCITPCAFQVAAGVTESIGVPSPQSGVAGTRSAWSSWSDNGARLHDVTVTGSPATYNATFVTQYLLTLAASPTTAGSIAANPASADGYYNSGAVVQLTASGTGASQFSGWSGALSGSTNPGSVTMTAPRSVTASFTTGPTFSITGRITLNSANLAGIAVALSGSVTASTVTDANGNYSFPVVAGGGTYTVTPAPNGYSFNPASTTITGLNGNSTANFTATTLPGLRFVALPPCRLMETRAEYNFEGRTGAFGPPFMRAGETRTLTLANSNVCQIPATAKAYVLNVTLIPRGAVDYVTLWPGGEARPAFWTVRSPDAQTVANAAIVKAGAGAVSVYASNDADLLIDISGYFTDAVANGVNLVYYPLTPCRVIDTRIDYRSPVGPFGPPSMGKGEARQFRFPATPYCPVPSGATAYSVTLTVAPPQPLPYMTLWPAGGSQPNVSSINSFIGRVLANNVIVPASGDGSVSVFAFDRTDFLVDINGYFAPDNGSTGLYYYPVTQCRASDSTVSGGAYADDTARTIAVPAAGNCAGIPATAKGYVVNVTAIPGGSPVPFITAYPTGQGRPNASILNAFDGQVVTNTAIVPAGTGGAIDVYAYRRSNVVVEISGYFNR